MIEFNCEICGAHVRKAWSASNPGTPRFCSIACKSEAQRRSKHVDRDWLYQKYIVEELSANDIAAIVKRHPKRVWEWLRDYGIPTRPRGAVTSGTAFAAGTQAFKGMRHTPEAREKIRQARLRDGHVPYLKNGKHHLKGKCGADTPNWKGGITPERQRVYGTREWKEAVKAVWQRADARCERCGKDHRESGMRGTFAVHHIVSFAVPESRCDPDNLILLCRSCHLFIHSRENVDKELIG